MKNRATTKGCKRIRQSAWCCGLNYQRWRFSNGAFPAALFDCAICHKPLRFKKITNASLDRYYRRRKTNLASGLTTHGTLPRRMNFNIPTPLQKAWRAFRSDPSRPIQTSSA